MVVSNGRLSAEITNCKANGVVLISDTTFGALARLCIVPLGNDSEAKYKSWLNKDSAIVHSACSTDGINYRRYLFTSAPDSLIAIRLVASQVGALSFRLDLTSPKPHRVRASRGQLTMLSHTTGTNSLPVRACCIVRLEHDGRQVATADTALSITSATTATIYIVARSSRSDRLSTESRDFVSHTVDDAWHTVNLTYDEFLSRHVAYTKREKHLGPKTNSSKQPKPFITTKLYQNPN